MHIRVSPTLISPAVIGFEAVNSYDPGGNRRISACGASFINTVCPSRNLRVNSFLVTSAATTSPRTPRRRQASWSSLLRSAIEVALISTSCFERKVFGVSATAVVLRAQTRSPGRISVNSIVSAPSRVFASGATRLQAAESSAATVNSPWAVLICSTRFSLLTATTSPMMRGAVAGAAVVAPCAVCPKTCDWFPVTPITLTSNTNEYNALTGPPKLFGYM